MHACSVRLQLCKLAAVPQAADVQCGAHDGVPAWRGLVRSGGPAGARTHRHLNLCPFGTLNCLRGPLFDCLRQCCKWQRPTQCRSQHLVDCIDLGRDADSRCGGGSARNRGCERRAERPAPCLRSVRRCLCRQTGAGSGNVWSMRAALSARLVRCPLVSFVSPLRCPAVSSARLRSSGKARSQACRPIGRMMLVAAAVAAPPPPQPPPPQAPHHPPMRHSFSHEASNQTMQVCKKVRRVSAAAEHHKQQGGGEAAGAWAGCSGVCSCFAAAQAA